jgi:hypothetical protein
VPASAAAPITHRVADARDRLSTARSSLASSEHHARFHTRALLRKGAPERVQREADSLLRQRDQLHELVRLYREDGSRRPMHEPALEFRDFRAALPNRPTRVACGIELWEHAGHIHVRLAAEPGQWLARILHLSGMSRSRKRGEDRIWSQPSSPLGRYWAHWLAEHESEKDANSPELVAERFAAGEVPPDQAGAADADDNASAAPLLAATVPPVVTVSMRLAERIVALAEPGQAARAWQDAAHETLSDATDTEREEAVRVVRERILTIANGAIVEDEWLRAFKSAWGSARRALIAARLFADQPFVVAAAELARERRRLADEPLPPEDADVISDEALDTLLPADLSAATRQRARRALGDALVALGLAERERHGRTLRATRPTAAAAAWGWLLVHELRRDRRVEAPEAWALRKSLAARLLGYGEGTARWAMDAAYAEGWFTQSSLAGEPRLLLVRDVEKAPASAASGKAPASAASGKAPAQRASEPQAVREEWVTGATIDRSGAAVYTHLIRAEDDPERTDIRALPEALRDRAAEWRRALKKTSVDTWKWAIWRLLSDGQPRTFNRIGVELLDKTADVLLDLPPDRALWALVAEQKIEHTTHAPILFRVRAGATPPPEPTSSRAASTGAESAIEQDAEDEDETGEIDVEIDAAPAEAPRPTSAVSLPPPEAHRAHDRVVVFRWASGNYYIWQAEHLTKASGLGFERARALSGPYQTRAVAAGSPEAKAMRAALRAEQLEHVVTEHDVTSDFVFGRTRAPKDSDRGATVTITSSADGSRVVAVARRDLDWQAARYGAAWEPFDSKGAVAIGTKLLTIEDTYWLRPQSDETWVVGGRRGGVDHLRVARDFEHALNVAENRRARDAHQPLPWPDESPAPRPERVRVVGWRDGGPVIAFPLVWPKQETELHLLVTALLPSGAKRTKGERWRRVEKTEVTITENGTPVNVGRDAREEIKSIAFAAIEELPEDAKERPKGATRTPPPFALGQGVRYVGETAHGLETGVVGVVEHIRRPREQTFDLSEIVFPSGHVEVVAAGPDAARFEALPVGAPAPAAPSIPGNPALVAAKTRGLARMLEMRVASMRALAASAERSWRTATSDELRKLAESQVREWASKLATDLRHLWRVERVARVTSAAVKAAGPSAQPAPAPEPVPVPVPADIEAQRAAFAEKRERRIEGLRTAGEKRLGQGSALFQQTKAVLDMIPLGQPNIVDTVSGRRFARQREKLHERHRRSWDLLEQGRALVARAEVAEANTAIFSDDPDAIDKLKEAIAEREETQAYMKEINVAVRAGDRAKLAELGLDEAKVAKLFTPDFAGRMGFPSYALANNLNQIQRLRERVKLLEKQRRDGSKAPEKYGAIEVREEDNRVRIFFPGKPSEQDRKSLKQSGFKWSPTAGAWQRHASSTAWSLARDFARKLGGAPADEERGSTEPAVGTGVSELAALVMRILVRSAEQSTLGLAKVGDVVEEARAFSAKDKEQIHAALRDLEDAGLIELRSWGPHPPGATAALTPIGAEGEPLTWGRPLTQAKETRDDPIVGYRVIFTMVVDHPERRDATLPQVPAGYRYDHEEYATERASAERRIAELRAGRTSDDFGSEYAAEIGVAAVTRLRRWAGWVIGPEPRVRPAGSDA